MSRGATYRNKNILQYIMLRRVNWRFVKSYLSQVSWVHPYTLEQNILNGWKIHLVQYFLQYHIKIRKLNIKNCYKYNTQYDKVKECWGRKKNNSVVDILCHAILKRRFCVYTQCVIECPTSDSKWTSTHVRILKTICHAVLLTKCSE